MQEIVVDQRVIRFRRAGQGPLVVLLHCSSSQSGQWRSLMDRLQDRFTLVAPDLPGYGRADPLPRDGQPAFRHDADLVAALIGAEGGQAHLVGHSLGGTVALRLAVERPEMVRSLCLIEPVQFAILDQTGAPEALEAKHIAEAVTGHLHLRDPKAAARSFIDFWSGTGAFDALEPRVSDYVVRTIGRVMDDWVSLWAGAPGQLTPADFAGIRAPTRLILGDRTRAPARAVIAALTRVLPRAEVVTVAGADHMAAALAPALIDPVIVDHLVDIPAEGP